jgi:hypothetical protein
MDAYDRYTNLEKILPILLPSMVEAEKFSHHPLTSKTLIVVLRRKTTVSNRKSGTSSNIHICVLNLAVVRGCDNLKKVVVQVCEA